MDLAGKDTKASPIQEVEIIQDQIEDVKISHKNSLTQKVLQ